MDDRWSGLMVNLAGSFTRIESKIEEPSDWAQPTVFASFIIACEQK